MARRARWSARFGGGRSLVALAPALVAAWLASSLGACGTRSSGDTGTALRVFAGSPRLLAPLSVLDQAQTVAVYVFDVIGDDACDATTGLATSGGQRLALDLATQQTDLTTASCAIAGARYCGSLTVPQSSTAKLFQVIAYGANQTELGDGCARATVTGTTVALPLITLVRFLAPSTCGDGVVGATEQCEPGLASDAALCDSSCHSVETFLSSGLDTDGQTATSDAQVKSDPFLLWPQASDTSGSFLAFFTDYPTGHKQIGMRALAPTMEPTSAFGSAAMSAFIWLPNDPNGSFPPAEIEGSQSTPAAALVGASYQVVYADDDNTTDGSPDIHLRTMDLSLTAQQPAGEPVVVNGGPSGEPLAQVAPSLAAGPNGNLLVTWVDQSSSTAVARTVDETTQGLGEENVLGPASGADEVSVASTGSGWVTVWTDSGNVHLQVMGASGQPTGSVVTVNTSSGAGGAHARVAALPDGRYAVTWSGTGSGASGADVFFQRYAKNGVAVAGDSAVPVHQLSSAGDQTEPTIAPLTSDSGAFAVSWIDGPSGQVHARYLGGSSGFLYNNVDGQDGEFVASVTDAHTAPSPRSQPAAPVRTSPSAGKTRPAAPRPASTRDASPFPLEGRRSASATDENGQRCTPR